MFNYVIRFHSSIEALRKHCLTHSCYHSFKKEYEGCEAWNAALILAAYRHTIHENGRINKDSSMSFNGKEYNFSKGEYFSFRFRSLLRISLSCLDYSMLVCLWSFKESQFEVDPEAHLFGRIDKLGDWLVNSSKEKTAGHG